MDTALDARILVYRRSRDDLEACLGPLGFEQQPSVCIGCGDYAPFTREHELLLAPVQGYVAGVRYFQDVDEGELLGAYRKLQEYSGLDLGIRMVQGFVAGVVTFSIAYHVPTDLAAHLLVKPFVAMGGGVAGFCLDPARLLRRFLPEEYTAAHDIVRQAEASHRADPSEVLPMLRNS